MSLVSLHLESIVMAEVPVLNGQHRPVVWIADLYPQHSSLSFAFFTGAPGLKTLLLCVLWDLPMKCWGRPSASPTSPLCVFLHTPSICRLPLLRRCSLNPLRLHSFPAPLGHIFSMLLLCIFFQAVSHLPLYRTCGTGHARVLSCTLLLQRGLGWVLSASSLSFGVICLSFACYILLLRVGTCLIRVLQGSLITGWAKTS